MVSCWFISDEKLSEIRICSLTLRYLRMWDCKHKKHKMVIDLPSLVEVSIKMFLYRNGAEQRSVLAAFSCAKEAHVGLQCMQVVAI